MLERHLWLESSGGCAQVTVPCPAATWRFPRGDLPDWSELTAASVEDRVEGGARIHWCHSGAGIGRLTNSVDEGRI